MAVALRSLAGLVLALCLFACTPEETAYWQQFAGPLATGGTPPCGQWVGTVRVAGFTEQEAEIALTLMWRESNCLPDAYNPSGATGLMQVMAMWADDCGGTPADLFEPQFNLNCARHVYEVQGWEAWSTWGG